MHLPTLRWTPTKSFGSGLVQYTDQARQSGPLIRHEHIHTTLADISGCLGLIPILSIHSCKIAKQLNEEHKVQREISPVVLIIWVVPITRKPRIQLAQWQLRLALRMLCNPCILLRNTCIEILINTNKEAYTLKPVIHCVQPPMLPIIFTVSHTLPFSCC